MARVYAMDTLLIQKGIYTTDEFESMFIEWLNMSFDEALKVASRDERFDPRQALWQRSFRLDAW
jgi:hypothetical protein